MFGFVGVVAPPAGAPGGYIRRRSIVRLTKDSTPCNFAMKLRGGAVRRRWPRSPHSQPVGKRMEYRRFGKTELKVSAIGFGCWEIGGTYGRINESQFTRAVRSAVDNGINCFDTAEAYGMGVSERALARALGNRRRDVAIVTKFGVGYDEMPNRRDASRGRVLASIEKSLKRLGTDHVDVYLVHWPDRATPLDETMGALDDIVRQGKARHIGVSNFRLEEIEAAMRLRPIDVVQYGWNLFDRRMQAEIFPYCRAHRIGVMAYGSLAYGMLAGTFTAGMRFEESDWRS